MAGSWYAVHTIAGHEKKVRGLIERMADNQNLWQREIFEVLIPEEQSLTTRNGKRMELPRKVFPGYILIRMIYTDDSKNLIKRTSGVTGFLVSGTKPVPIPDEDVQAIMRRIEASKETPVIPWQRGDNVRVIEGAFADFPGKVEEVIADKQKLKVMLMIFGRDTSVELDFSSVEKV